MEEKLKIGLVGASAQGGWSPVAHIPALKALKNVELAALCTSRPESAKAASEAFGIERAYSNINELVAQPDLDIISSVVKIPNHYEVVKTALEANKHVYCEWPLGASLEETEELTKLANEKGLVTAIGLQGHHAPELLYIKQLIEQKWFGQVINVSMTLQSKGSAVKASKEAWEEEKHRKATLFSIVGGHTIYYLSYVFGGIEEVAAQLSTQFKPLTLNDTGEQVDNNVVDQINIHGLLNKGIPFSSQLTAVPNHSKGWSMKIYGTTGSLVATSPIMPQITPIELMGAKGEEEMERMEVPNELVKFEYLPKGPAGNVGRNYGSMAAAISMGKTFHPNFDDALMVHRLLETIQQSSDQGRTIKAL